MTKISKTIVFFGTDNFSLIALQSLVSSGYKVSAVVTKPDSKMGRGQILTPPVVKSFALKHNIPVWQPSKISDINDEIAALGPNIIGVLVSYGKIIPKSTIDLFNPGIINLHPSLLPLYRGPSPIESAIANGDEQTGVSIMKLTPEMDAGPIYGKVVVKLSNHETQPELYETLARFGAMELLKLLPVIANGSLDPVEQDDSKVLYCQLLNKDDSVLEPSKLTALQAERLVRAHLDFPRTKIGLVGHMVIITKAHVSNEQKTALDMRCKDNNYLSIDELIAPSGRKMTATDFINGYC